MQKISPFLWFDTQAEDAARFYVSVFKDAAIKHIARYGAGGPGPAGSVMTVNFTLMGQDFVALNGGPHYTFNEAVSFVINCDTQEEVDHYWEKLTDGGKEIACGWLRDKFGLTWQVVPVALPKYLMDSDPARAQRVMAAMMQMKKIELPKLEEAYNG